MIQILVADDHDLMRRGVRDLLLERSDWQVCAEARNGREAVSLAVQLHPDVAVLDISMPELNGLDATRRIRKQAPNTEVLIFTEYENEELVREVLRAGARGYVLKSDASSHLVSAVDALAMHQPFLTPGVSKTLLTSVLDSSEPTRTPSTELTDREREIVQMLAEGKSNIEVANVLYISPNTVETHRAKIMRKLGISSIVGLVHYAVRHKLIKV